MLTPPARAPLTPASDAVNADLTRGRESFPMFANRLSTPDELRTASRVPAAERALFLAVALAGAATFWLAPRLPMVDLPQHVGQVTLWRDLLLGVSPFAGDVRINLFTPYLIGYGFALPLAFAMDAGEALRLVLAASFLAYLAAARGLRRELGGDPRLDWLFLFGFFGVGWSWGLYTFLVAAPWTLATLRLAVRFDAAPTLARAAALTAAGALLLFCHGLQFLFMLAAGAAITLERAWRTFSADDLRAATAAAGRRVAPYAALAVLLLLFMAARAVALGPEPSTSFAFGAPLWTRPANAIVHIWGESPRPVFVAATIIALYAPLQMGFAPARGPGLALFLTVVAVSLFNVSIALNTGFLYERFALYLAPFWALALKPVPNAGPRRRAHGALVAAACVCLAGHGARIAAFADEDRDFQNALAAVAPGERALGVVLDRSSAAAGSRFVYQHWPVWAQSARGAFVDFNFAYFHPQVVRFRPERTPRALQAQNENPQLFDWNEWDAGRYDVVIARGSRETQKALLLDRSPCRLEAVATAADWTAYRKRDCRE